MARETPKKTVPELVELLSSNLCVTCGTNISLGRPSSRGRRCLNSRKNDNLLVTLKNLPAGESLHKYMSTFTTRDIFICQMCTNVTNRLYRCMTKLKSLQEDIQREKNILNPGIIININYNY